MEEKKLPVIQNIKPAFPEDASAVWGIIKVSSDWLLAQGHSHWDKYYSAERILQKIQSADVRIAYADGQAVSTIALDTKPVAYYTKENMESFAEPEAKALYVSALATIPEYQGKGIASKLMDVAENEAISRKIEYVRFDCKASLLELVEFYKKRGYKEVGLIIDDEDNYERYYLMEKKLVLRKN